jgi:hypothetical protein
MDMVEGPRGMEEVRGMEAVRIGGRGMRILMVGAPMEAGRKGGLAQILGRKLGRHSR